MLWTPATSALVLHVAVLATAIGTAAQPAMFVPESLKLTVPVGAAPVTVAVNVTVAPARPDSPSLRAVVVDARLRSRPAVAADAARAVEAERGRREDSRGVIVRCGDAPPVPRRDRVRWLKRRSMNSNKGRHRTAGEVRRSTPRAMCKSLRAGDGNSHCPRSENRNDAEYSVDVSFAQDARLRARAEDRIGDRAVGVENDGIEPVGETVEDAA